MVRVSSKYMTHIPSNVPSKDDTPFSSNTVAAVSLLNDVESLFTRRSASRYLSANTNYPDESLPELWRALTQESDQAVMEYLLEGLGQLGPRGKNSIPLLAYLLGDHREGVVRYAAESLIQLSDLYPHALISVFSATENRTIHAVRSEFLARLIDANDPAGSSIVREYCWVRDRSKKERADWVHSLPKEGVTSLSTEDRLRFMLILANPEGLNIGSCLAYYWYSNDSREPRSDTILSEFSACVGSIFRVLADGYDGLSKIRWQCRALHESKQHMAALSLLTGKVESSTPKQLAIVQHATAIELLPASPPRESLDALIESLWGAESAVEREHALSCLRESIPRFGDSSVRLLIGKVINLLRHPPIIVHRPKKTSLNALQERYCREAAEILIGVTTNYVAEVVERIRDLCNSGAPAISKRGALPALIFLRYQGTNDPNYIEAIAVLAGFVTDKKSGLSHIASYCLKSLKTRMTNLENDRRIQTEVLPKEII
jgi:hypothetical protein